MTPAEIIAEIGEIEKELLERFYRLQGLSHGLYSRAQRSPDDNTRNYVRLANAWGRYSGAAAQGVPARTTKLVKQRIAATPEPRPEPKRETANRSRVEEKGVVATGDPMEALLEMYAPKPKLTDA